jgi:hypothetical protein
MILVNGLRQTPLQPRSHFHHMPNGLITANYQVPRRLWFSNISRLQLLRDGIQRSDTSAVVHLMMAASQDRLIIGFSS